jgi:hypothetical protein
MPKSKLTLPVVKSALKDEKDYECESFQNTDIGTSTHPHGIDPLLHNACRPLAANMEQLRAKRAIQGCKIPLFLSRGFPTCSPRTRHCTRMARPPSM